MGCVNPLSVEFVYVLYVCAGSAFTSAAFGCGFQTVNIVLTVARIYFCRKAVTFETEGHFILRIVYAFIYTSQQNHFGKMCVFYYRKRQS